jgi:hypothetical protein
MKVRLPRAPVSFCESASLAERRRRACAADARAQQLWRNASRCVHASGCPAGEEIRYQRRPRF